MIRRIIEAVRGEAVWLYASRFGTVLAQTVVFFAVAAAAGVEVFGRFSFLFSATQVVAVLLALGGSQFLQRELPARDAKYRGEGSQRLVLTVLRRTGSAFFAVVLALVALWLMFPSAASFATWRSAFIVLGVAFLVSCLAIAISVVRVARTATYSLLLRDLLPYFFFLSGIGLLVYFDDMTAENLLLAYGGGILACLIIAARATTAYLSARSGPAPETDGSKSPYMTFWYTSMLGALFAQLDILIARLFLGDAVLGTYALIRRVTNLVSLPQIIANWSINVRVAYDFALNNQPALQQHAQRGLLLSLPVAIIMTVFIAGTSPVWLGFFNLAPTLDVIVLLAILLTGQLLNVAAGANLLFAAQCHEESYALVARAIALVFGASIMAPGAVLIGEKGIALGTAASIAVLNLLVLLHIKRKVGVWTSIPLPTRDPAAGS